MNSTIIVRSACAALVLLIAACASEPKDGPLKPVPQRTAAEERAAAEKLYRSAREALDSGDMTTAMQRYDKLSQQFPFSEYATQGDLERIYALYRNYQPDQALSAADKFVREHPRHPGAAYAQYLKGLVNSTRDQGLSGFIGLDTTKEDVGFLRNAFDDFAVLVRKYPSSPYVGDARQRMIDLRNRVAQHEMHIVRFYVKRGAYVAAAKRAEQVITQYPGAPASLEALKLLQDSYRKLDLTQQADDAGRLLAALAQKQGENDYPGFGTVESLPPPVKDNSPARVIPVDDRSQVEDSGWLQNLLSVFGGDSAKTAAADNNAPPPAAPAAENEKDDKDVNLADVLKATFGRQPSTPAKPSDSAQLTTEQAKTQQTKPDGTVQVVPVGQAGGTQPTPPAAPAAPEDKSFLGQMKRLLNRERTDENLAPGGRAKASTTPLIKQASPPPAPAPASAETPPPAAQGNANTAPTEAPRIPPASEEDSWFSKLANFFGASSSSGNLAPGGRVPTSKEPLIKETPAEAAPPAKTTASEPAAPTLPASKPVVRKVTPEKQGNWFTRLFSIFDSSDSEPYTVVIPTAPAPQAPSEKSAAPETSTPSEKSGSNIKIEMEPYDDTPASGKPAATDDPAQPQP